MEEPAWAAVLRFGALARLARAHVFGDVDVLANPEGEAPYQRPRLGAPEVSTKWPVMALAKHLCPQSAAGGDAEAVKLALPATVQEAAAHQERTAFRCPGGVDDGRAPPVDELAECRRRATQNGPEERVDGELCHQGLDERW